MIGGIPFGWLLARLTGVDVRWAGSGNIGATNVLRLTNWRVGSLTLCLDTLKGWAPALIGSLGGEERLAAGMGCAAILGHVYSPYLGFKGGKGVATAMGVFLLLSPLAVGGAVVLFLMVVTVVRVVAVGSILAAGVLPLLVLATNGLGYASSLAGFAGVLVVTRHVRNIRQLFSLNETSDLGWSRPGAEDPKSGVRGDIRPSVYGPLRKKAKIQTSE
ncbi:MAG: glycerol-3-phosphate acyltransferase [Myxococcales bacterium]|nr:glycerol-3-phosphate acyltransferase [Myxococcales bacterium]